MENNNILEMSEEKKIEFYKTLANFTLNDLLAISNKRKCKHISELGISPILLSNLVALKVYGELTLKELKEIVELIVERRKPT